MKRRQNDFPSVELLAEEVERRQDLAKLHNRVKNILLLTLALLWALAVLR